jgi:hypothetical protein
MSVCIYSKVLMSPVRQYVDEAVIKMSFWSQNHPFGHKKGTYAIR